MYIINFCVIHVITIMLVMHIKLGEMTLDSLCSQKDFESLVPKSFLEDYINLLETFGIALKDINHQNLLIPSLLPIKRHYPPVKSTNDKWPLLTRFWPCTEISDGFWPKLICRVVGDQDIDNVRLLQGVSLFYLLTLCNLIYYTLSRKKKKI